MAPLALLLLLALPAAADPPRNPCNAWSGSTARLPLRECGGIPEGALRYAQRCMRAFGDRLASRRHVVFADWTVAQEFTRLFVVEWDQEDPYRSVNVLRGGLAHGSGNGSASGETPTEMRDQWNSYGTPAGCMRLYGTGEAGQMSTAPSMKAYRLDGLETRNACVLERGLYFHEYPGRVELRRTDAAAAPRDAARPFQDLELGRNLALGFSNGCVSLNETDFAYIQEQRVVPAKGGVLFVSWDGHDIQPMPRVANSTADCRRPTRDVRHSVAPTLNQYEKIIEERMQEAQRALFSDPTASP